MYDDLVERLRYCAVSDNQCLECKYRGGSPDGSKMCFDLLMEDAADAIEERDRYALTLQHEMMAEAESHIALVERLNKQIKYWEDVVKTALDFIPCWVSVTKRLPEKGRPVLCACRANIFCVLKWDGIDWVENPTHVYMRGFVTHWMPLPDPPEEET